MKLQKNKRAQMEMFGLAVIVILITVGLFFVVKFKSSEKPVQYQKEYVVTQGAENFVTAASNVGIAECNGQETLRSLLIDCANKANQINCRGYDSCELANKTIGKLLNLTFQEWNYKYRFYTDGLDWPAAYGHPGDDERFRGEIYFNNLNCTDTDNKGQTGVLPIRLYPLPGTLPVFFELCS